MSKHALTDGRGDHREEVAKILAGRGFHSAAREVRDASAALTAAHARIAELERLINTPATADFLEAVTLEAAHQVERWGANHDAGKTAADWFWLLGYLGGKAMAAEKAGDGEKLKHHIITTAAACLNWHRAVTGEDTRMRPGIMPPASETAAGARQ